MSDALIASPLGSQRSSFRSAAGGSPAAGGQLNGPFQLGMRHSPEMHDSSDVWPAHAMVAPRHSSEVSAATWHNTGAAQLSDGYLPEAMVLPLRGDSPVSAPRGASDSEEDPYSSPDTTLLYPGFSAGTDPEAAHKSASPRPASGFHAPVVHSTSDAPLVTAKLGGQSPPQLRRSSLTLAMRGEDAATAAAAAVQSAVANTGTALAPGRGAALRSLSEPVIAARGAVSVAPVAVGTAGPGRDASMSPLSSNLAAALKRRSPIARGDRPGPAANQSNFPEGETYTLTTSDAAAIATAQQHAHPTVRGPAPPPADISPFTVAQPCFAVAGSSPAAPKAAAVHSQGPAFSKVCAA